MSLYEDLPPTKTGAGGTITPDVSRVASSNAIIANAAPSTPNLKRTTSSEATPTPSTPKPVPLPLMPTKDSNIFVVFVEMLIHYF